MNLPSGQKIGGDEMQQILPISTDELASYACVGFVPALLTIWFIISIVLFFRKGKMTGMIVSGIFMTLSYVGLIFLYYTFAQIMQSM